MGKKSGLFKAGALGAIGGLVAGVLFAPKSGKETRQDIKKGAKKAKGVVEKQLKETYEDLRDLTEDGKKEISKLKGSAKDQLANQIEKTEELLKRIKKGLSAYHEGEATDSELEKLTEKANKSLADLRQKLSKEK